MLIGLLREDEIVRAAAEFIRGGTYAGSGADHLVMIAPAMPEQPISFIPEPAHLAKFRTAQPLAHSPPPLARFCSLLI